MTLILSVPDSPGDFKYIFLDEIQNVDGWPLFVNRLLRMKIHVVLTGSNAKLLSNDLATHLTGRSSEISPYPFSFAEYRTMKSVNCDLQTTKGIQVSYDITAEKTRKREIKCLLLAGKQTRCENLLLLTDHEYEDVSINGKQIQIRPVYDWCVKL